MVVVSMGWNGKILRFYGCWGREGDVKKVRGLLQKIVSSVLVMQRSVIAQQGQCGLPGTCPSDLSHHLSGNHSQKLPVFPWTYSVYWERTVIFKSEKGFGHQVRQLFGSGYVLTVLHMMQCSTGEIFFLRPYLCFCLIFNNKNKLFFCVRKKIFSGHVNIWGISVLMPWSI